MSLDLTKGRLFVDGYGSKQDISEDLSVMQRVLEAANLAMFKGLGSTRIIPVLDSPKPQNNGLSGLIVAPGGHFTCHTFSHRGVFFVDAYSSQAKYDEHDVEDILSDNLRPQRLQFCRDDLGDSFGRHVVLRLPSVKIRAGALLVKRVMGDIQMRPLSRTMLCICGANISILQPITESHISLHVTDDGAVMDVFSCKDYSLEKLIASIEAFGLRPLEVATVSRGIYLADKIL